MNILQCSWQWWNVDPSSLLIAMTHFFGLRLKERIAFIWKELFLFRIAELTMLQHLRLAIVVTGSKFTPCQWVPETWNPEMWKRQMHPGPLRRPSFTVPESKHCQVAGGSFWCVFVSTQLHWPHRTIHRDSSRYWLPEHKKNWVRDELKSMIKMGVFEESHSAWCSLVVLVPKADGGWNFFFGGL